MARHSIRVMKGIIQISSVNPKCIKLSTYSLPVCLLTDPYLHLHLTSTVFSAACTTASVGVVFSSKDAIKLPANTAAASLDVAATAFTNSPVKVFAVVEVVTR